MLLVYRPKRTPSFRTSASERLKLRQMLLNESGRGSSGGGLANYVPVRNQRMGAGNTSISQPVLHTLPISNQGASQHSVGYNNSSQGRSFQNSVLSSSMDKSNEEWPEFNQSSNLSCQPSNLSRRSSSNHDFLKSLTSQGSVTGDNQLAMRRSTMRTSNYTDNKEKSNINFIKGSNNTPREENAEDKEDYNSSCDGSMLGFNNAVRLNRHASMPDMGTTAGRQNVRRQQSGDFTNSLTSNSNNSIMGDYIALKLNVAQLQSDLQVAQAQAKKFTTGLNQAQEVMAKLKERNVKLGRRNEELEEENVFYIELMGNLERLGRLEGLKDMLLDSGGSALFEKKKNKGDVDGRPMPKRMQSWKKTELDWGDLSESDKFNEENLLEMLRDPNAVGDAGKTKSQVKRERGPSWWNTSSDTPQKDSTQDHTISRSLPVGSKEIIVKDMPLNDDDKGKSRLSQSHSQKSGESGGCENKSGRSSGTSSWFQRSTDLTGNDQTQQRNSNRTSGTNPQQSTTSFVETILNLPRTLSRSMMGQGDNSAPRNDKQTTNSNQMNLQLNRIDLNRRVNRHVRRQHVEQKQAKQSNDDGQQFPEVVQFLDSDSDLRCSDITFDVQAFDRLSVRKLKDSEDEEKKDTLQPFHGEEDVGLDLSGIDEQESFKLYNSTPSANTASHKDQLSMSAATSAAESFHQWHTGGALGFSITETHVEGGVAQYTHTPLAPQCLPVGADTPRSQSQFVDSEKSWTSSQFDFSTVGSKSVNEGV